MKTDPLRTLAEARPAELSPDAPVDPAVRRAELTHAMTTPRETSPARRPARRFRPVLALSLAGAAAAAAAAIVVVPGGGSDAPAGGALAAPQEPTARTVLMAAAERAAAAPASGKYWLVSTLTSKPVKSVHSEWITLDGRRWTGYRTAAPAPGSKAAELHKLKGLAPMAATVLGPSPSLAALRGLPADPKALRRLAERNFPNKIDTETRKPVETKAAYVAQALLELLAEQPVTPQVRAAGFRALADLPGVSSKGGTRDALGRKGELLVFSQYYPHVGTVTKRLVINPKTSQVLSLGEQTTGRKPHKSELLYLTTGWTNQAPSLPRLP
ncbi:CU044_5270 family protein [Spirillospora sp. NPDC050679]